MIRLHILLISIIFLKMFFNSLTDSLVKEHTRSMFYNKTDKYFGSPLNLILNTMSDGLDVTPPNDTTGSAMGIFQSP